MVIGQKRAIEIYLSHRKTAFRTVQMISLWDEEATLGKNRKNLRSFGVEYIHMQTLAKSYGLKRARMHPGRKSGPLQEQAERALEMMEKGGLTLQEIGKVYGVSRQRVEQVFKKHKIKMVPMGKGE